MNIMQEKLLLMLRFLHEFCVSKGIRYYAIGGTMLGIARHKGFIPWDDDIDIGMPRNDYELFIELFKNEQNDYYTIETPASNDPAYIYPFSKMYDTRTTLIEKLHKPLKRGIYIDIFPLDGIGNSIQDAKKVMKKIESRKKVLNLRTLAIDRNRFFGKNVILRLIQALPNIVLNNKKLICSIDNLCKNKDFDSSNLAGNLVGAWGWKEIMPREFFGEPTLYTFENISVMGVEKVDAYLSHLYNDWRNLPSEEKQVTHHSYTVDFNKSYLG